MLWYNAGPYQRDACCGDIELKLVSLVKLGRFARYAHALAGFAVLASGLAVQFLGL
jgi:hypothetical protein